MTFFDKTNKFHLFWPLFLSSFRQRKEATTTFQRSLSGLWLPSMGKTISRKDGKRREMGGKTGDGGDGYVLFCSSHLWMDSIFRWRWEMTGGTLLLCRRLAWKQGSRMLEDGRHTPSAGWATSVATGWAWRSRETIFRWEDQENIRIFCGQIHQRKLQSHDFSGADGHDEGSSKHPMDSAVDYAAESSAFRELCFEVGRVQLQAIFISASTCDA